MSPTTVENNTSTTPIS